MEEFAEAGGEVEHEGGGTGMGLGECHAEDYIKSVGTVPATLTVHLAPGGGFALKTK